MACLKVHVKNIYNHLGEIKSPKNLGLFLGYTDENNRLES